MVKSVKAACAPSSRPWLAILNIALPAVNFSTITSTGSTFVNAPNDKKGTDNKLVIYIITEKDFNGTLTFKVLDKKGVESGRQALKLTAKAGEAGYKEVIFDERTNIQNSYTIEIN